jgi:hypothetical protein
MKQIQLLILGAVVICFTGCSKDKDDGTEPIVNNDSIMIELLTEATCEGHTLMDITPIPIQPELYDYAAVDTSFQNVIEAIENFNNLLQNPGFLLETSEKSAQEVEWEFKGCTTIGNVSECIWELDKGNYIYRSTQTIESISGTTQLETEISGTFDGFFYGELGEDFYRISDWTTSGHGTLTIINTYFTPFNEYVDGEPVFTYIYSVGEGYTIYTPWGGTEYILNVMYQNIIYSWDYIDGHHPSIQRISEWHGDLLTTIVSTWCLGDLGLRPTYSSSYDFEDHEGAWCSYDCNGIPFSCGSY